MNEGESVRILIGVERRLVHQSSDGKMRHQQAVELLFNEFGRLAAQHNLGAAQVSLQLVQRGFYFPALVIQRRQFLGGSLFGIQNGSDQAIHRLSIRHIFQAVIDRAHHNRFALIPAIRGGSIKAAQIGAVRQAPVDLQGGVLASAPQQIRSCLCRCLPELGTGKEAVRQAQHALVQGGRHLLSQRDLIGGIRRHLGGPKDVRSILQQPDLGKALDPRLAPGLPKAASFSAVSATSSVLPSRLTSRQSRYQAPFVRRSAMGATIASYNACIGSAPKRLRACEMPDLPATFTAEDGSSNHCTPSSKQRSTSRYEDRIYSAKAIT